MSLKKQQNSGKISYIFTRETMGMTLLLFSAIVFLMLLTREKVFAGLGTEICTFMYGTFGYGAIPVTVYLAYFGVRLTFGKSVKIKMSCFLTLTAAVLVLFLLFHSVTTRNFELGGFGGYLSECYTTAKNGWSGYTFGGAACGILVYPVAKLTTFIGAYIIYSVLFALCGYIMFYLIKRNMPPKEQREQAENGAQTESIPAATSVNTVSADSGYTQTTPAAQANYSDPNAQFVAQPQNIQPQPTQQVYAQYVQPDGQTQNYQNYQQPAEQQGYYNQPAEQTYGYPQSQGQAYTYRQPEEQQYSSYSSSAQSDEDDRYSRRNLGRKIIFEKGEFDAESYKRNMIYSGESYFNKPKDGVESYLSNFKVSPSSSAGSSGSSGSSPSSDFGNSSTSGSGASGSSGSFGSSSSSGYSSSSGSSSSAFGISFGSSSSGSSSGASYFSSPSAPSRDMTDSVEENPRSYTESYQEEVASRPVEETPSSYVFGEKPVENLDGGFEDIPPRAGERRSEPIFGDRNSDSERGSAELPRDMGIERERGSFDMLRDNAEERSTFERPREINIEHERTSFERPIENRSENIHSESGRGGELRREGDDFVRFTPERNPEKREEPHDREDLRRLSSDRQSDVTPLFGGESSRGERNASDRGRTENPDSKVNLFDDDENEAGEDVLGLSSRGERSDRGGLSEPESGAAERGERRGDRRPNDADDLRSARREAGFGVPSADRWKPAEKEVKEEPKPEKPKHVWKKYVRPPIDLLNDYPENNNVNTGEIEDNKRIIVETLEKFKIQSQISNVIVGPAITRYDVIIPDRTNIKRALSYRDEIALALMKDNVTVYLNYSKGAISIEIPNNKRTVVGLKAMLASPQYINCKPNSLTFGLGKNVEGAVVCPDITRMPHLLVAGTTGSGKSICLNALIVSLLYKYGPEELRLILVDPKQSEFITFRRLPHLMINEILYDVDKVIKALNWAIKEMERRYTLFKEMTENGVATRNLDEYNFNLPEGEEKLPKILIILDEFGDLMMQAKKDIEMRIIRLAQKARACGIHLILATQRPSVDCITGLIKSNLPSRIGFKVNSFDDSRTIFDVGGAEKLLGMGDMYFRSVEKPELTRIQGCYIDSKEVQKVTNFVRDNNETFFDEEATEFINKVEEPESSASAGGEDGEDSGEGKMDDTYLKALKYCILSNQASVSMIQRRFPVGYIKACKIIDWMDKMNYVTKSEGSKPRKVLMTMDEFTNTYGEVDD